MRLTRKVSPTIQLGAELELENSKKAPIHCDSLTCASKKSAGEMLHDDPPNVSDTDTSVSQAIIRVSKNRTLTQRSGEENAR